MELVDLLIINARIYTLDDENSVHEAVACKDELIVALGTSDELLSQYEAKMIFDADNRIILPGFIDLHAHLQSLGEEKLFVVDLRGTTSLNEAISRIRDRALRTPRGELIQARNWDESTWPENRYLTRYDLDQATTEHPVVAYREDGHMLTLNSLAIQEVGLEQLRGEKGVDVDQDSGELTGVVRDVPLNYQKLRPSPKQAHKSVLKGIKIAASLGITTVHDIVKDYQVVAYLRAWRLGELNIRVTLIPLAKKSMNLLESMGITGYFGDHWLRFGSIKFFADGSIGARTAYLSRPYVDVPDERGKPEYELSDFLKELKRARSLLFPVCVHAIGDAAIDMVLEALEDLEPIPPPPPVSIMGGKKWKSIPDRIEHAELLADEHLKRLEQLNVALSMQPNFLKWQIPRGLYEQRLGQDRVRWMNAFKKIIDSGILMGFGSDCMPLGPLYGINWAVNHPISGQSLSPREAILAYTRWAAVISGEQELKGTIEVGKLADMVVLSSNPFDQDPRALRAIRVIATFVGGRLVFDGRNALHS